MTIPILLNIISILEIIGLIVYLTYRVSLAKYHLYNALVRYFFYNDKKGLIYWRENLLYFWYTILIMALITTCLTLTGQLTRGLVAVRPLFSFISSPLIWLSLFIIIRMHTKKINKLERALEQ